MQPAVPAFWRIWPVAGLRSKIVSVLPSLPGMYTERPSGVTAGWREALSPCPSAQPVGLVFVDAARLARRLREHAGGAVALQDRDRLRAGVELAPVGAHHECAREVKPRPSVQTPAVPPELPSWLMQPLKSGFWLRSPVTGLRSKVATVPGTWLTT